jgi:hypothetical protein
MDTIEGVFRSEIEELKKRVDNLERVLRQDALTAVKLDHPEGKSTPGGFSHPGLTKFGADAPRAGRHPAVAPCSPARRLGPRQVEQTPCFVTVCRAGQRSR